jgi:hypothetical protein
VTTLCELEKYGLRVGSTLRRNALPAIRLVVKIFSCQHPSQRSAHARVKSWLFDALPLRGGKSCLPAILVRALHLVKARAASKGCSQGKQVGGRREIHAGFRKEPMRRRL